jgi:parallel beta-helix repeat protein
MAGAVLRLAGCLVAAALVNVGSAAADPTSLDLSEPAEPPLDPATLVTYAALPALGTVTAPDVVTDAELATAGVTPLEASAAAGPADFVVDDDLAQCADADFTTAAGIQLAVAAAPPGSVIRVCPGTYSPTTVATTLTLVAPRAHGQATQCTENEPPDPTRDAIVDGGGTPAIGFTLAADGIVLDGFTVQNTSGNPGIYAFPGFSGYELRFNVVQDNTFGLYLNASGTQQTIVERNCFRRNNRPGSASGDGIYSDQGLRNAVVRQNFFTANNSASMVFALNQQDLTIEHNESVDDAGTIVLVSTQGARVAHNHVSGRGTSSGLFVGGGVVATLAFNLIENASTGVNANIAFLVAPNQLIIERNHVRGATFDGIRFDATSNSTVRGNKTERTGQDGIRLRNGSNMNRVEQNLSRDNARDGLRVDGAPFAPSSGNAIVRNHMLGNGEHDCHDDTVGAGTGGTANIWDGNVGKTENRPGLCRNATVSP